MKAHGQSMVHLCWFNNKKKSYINFKCISDCSCFFICRYYKKISGPVVVKPVIIEQNSFKIVFFLLLDLVYWV